jgi:hypothetical protein
MVGRRGAGMTPIITENENADDYPETTYLVTFTALTPIRSITFVATTTDLADAKSLAYDDLIELIGYDEARHFTHTTTTEENE